jgi:hypothetical protein
MQRKRQTRQIKMLAGDPGYQYRLVMMTISLKVSWWAIPWLMLCGQLVSQVEPEDAAVTPNGKS